MTRFVSSTSFWFWFREGLLEEKLLMPMVPRNTKIVTTPHKMSLYSPQFELSLGDLFLRRSLSLLKVHAGFTFVSSAWSGLWFTKISVLLPSQLNGFSL
uniref:26S proteasome subunit S9 n=1 Tax=Solanum tuberosum TaxID=4113 RepID=M1CR29_SOLTU